MAGRLHRFMFRQGDPMIWLAGSGLGICLLMIGGLLVLVGAKGLDIFWPRELTRIRTTDGRVVLAEVWNREEIPEDVGAGGPGRFRIRVKIANRDLEVLDYRWIDESAIVSRDVPREAMVVERLEYGNFHGFEKVRRGGTRPVTVFVDAAGREKEIAVDQIVRVVRPNGMSVFEKLKVYGSRLREFVLGTPRESNTEGGIFPAIFGTVLMVILMSLVAVPFGVVTALYLREYAAQGRLVRLVRIAVNNLAGVPSIVFGIFGLGFFVYGIGVRVDQLLFSAALPTPTYGTGGILWCALTLALLTVPVVVVASEEALAAVPRGMREASLALGATKWQTTWWVVLPAAAPGILTGLILAMARGTGEVAPLMIVGVVKSAPVLPLDGIVPFLHLDRKIMHLGFHIYDVGFQSPNVEAALPMVYATTALLLGVVVALNLTAILIRNYLRKKLQSSTF